MWGVVSRQAARTRRVSRAWRRMGRMKSRSGSKVNKDFPSFCLPVITREQRQLERQDDRDLRRAPAEMPRVVQRVPHLEPAAQRLQQVRVEAPAQLTAADI